MRVEQDELWIKVGFDRKLAEQSRAEAVNRGDDCAVQRPLVTYPANPLAGSRGAQKLVELTPEPFAHLVSRAVGKGDGDDLVYSNAGGSEDMQVALDENGRLAGARTGGNRDVAVERMRGQFLLWLQLAILFVNYNAHNANARNSKLQISNCEYQIAQNEMASICNLQFSICNLQFSILECLGLSLHYSPSGESCTSRNGTPRNSRSADTNHQARMAQPGIGRREYRQ